MSKSIHLCLALVCMAALSGCPTPAPIDQDNGPEPPSDGTTFDAGSMIVYEIVTDRFVNGDGSNDKSVAAIDSSVNYRGGDLAGIEGSLDEISGMGFNAIIISSPLPSPLASGIRADGHAGADFQSRWPLDLSGVDQRFGSTGELTSLVGAAHERGMKVLIRFTPKQVHFSSPVYTTHIDWFHACEVLGAAISWDSPDCYAGWLRDYLPAFDYGCTDALNYALESCALYVSAYNLDGLILQEDSKWTDPKWAEGMKTRLAAMDQKVILAAIPWVTRLQYDSCLSSSHCDAVEDGDLRAAIISSLLARSSPCSTLGDYLGDNFAEDAPLTVNALGGESYPRIIHFSETTPLWTDPWTSGSDRAWSGQPAQPSAVEPYERLACAMTVQYSIPGIPVIFYGDEIGLAGGGDPDNMRFMPATELNQGQTILRDRIALLASIRKNNPVLTTGPVSIISQSLDTLCYKVGEGSGALIVVINRGDSPANISSLPASVFTSLISGSQVNGPVVEAQARSADILKTE